MTEKEISNKLAIASIKTSYICDIPQTLKTESEASKNGDEPPSKKQRKAGKNQNRPKFIKDKKENKLCKNIWCVPPNCDAVDKLCKYSNCCFSHDLKSFLEAKPEDISEVCFSYRTYGHCPFGITCRYGSSHIEASGSITDKNRYEKYADNPQSINFLNGELKTRLRKKRYDFSKSFDAIKEINIAINSAKKDEATNKSVCAEPSIMKEKNDMDGLETKEKRIPIKKIDWHNLLYLAPLTTLGNLPFRRVCKKLGADITCSEMAMASCLLQGSPSEWALMKRHTTEDLFGVQLCASNAEVMVKCSQLLNEQIKMDFVDINMGCPIDLVYKQGAGSALMRRVGLLETMVGSMNEVLSVPVTLKMRAGIYNNNNVAHEIIKKAKNWDVGLITVHGRSREQRYTKTANWDYINQCAILSDPVPLFGNGDILTYEDYNLQKNASNVAGIMIGRGSLIKPWIFTEIKEQRHWDISSSERLDILKDFVNFGLEHWGSDTEGVEKTRRFLLEWLSFTYRYIPAGILERVQSINQRPPSYFGRDELETMMASTSVKEWIKISEILLGKVPDNFLFLPKHKANSWS